MRTLLEKDIINAVKDVMVAAIEKKLTEYGSPLQPLINEVVKEHEQEIRSVLKEILSLVVVSKEFKEQLKDAFRHKVARSLVDNLDGSVKQAVEKLRQDPTIKAQMVLAIEKIVQEA